MNEESIVRLQRLLKDDPEGTEIAKVIAEMMEDRASRNALRAILMDLQRDSTSTVRASSRQVRPIGVQRALIDMFEGERILSTDEVTQMAEEYGYRSLGHKQHASSALNDAVRNGHLGKIRTSDGLKFSIPDIAVKENLKQNMWMADMRPEDVEPQDLLDLSEKTGLDIQAVSRIIYEMTHD